MDRGRGGKLRVRGQFISFALLCGLLWGFLTAHAQVLRFAHIDGEQGLSHNTVTAIYKDRQGFMWFGTVDGLNRFDGYQCQVWRHDPQDPSSLSSNFIHGLLETANGDFWVATRDGGLCRMQAADRAKGGFERFLPVQGDPTSLSHELIQAMTEDRSGRFWVGTAQGLDLFVPETRNFRHFNLYDDVDRTISGIIEDEQQRLWIASFGGLFALDLKTFNDQDPASIGEHLTRYDAQPGKEQSLPGNLLNGIFLDHLGQLWISVRGYGISRLDPNRGQFKHYRFEPNRPHGLPSANASVSYEDETGLLWIGTDGRGLVTLDPLTDRFTVHRHLPNRSSSLSSDNVTRIYRSHDGEPGSFWVTTWGGGVNLRIDDRKLFALTQHDPEDERSLSSNFVFALKEDRFGDLWVGTIGGGLNLRRKGESHWERFLHQEGVPNSLADNTIWSLQSDPDGNLWVCTEKGGVDLVRRASATAPIEFVHHRADAAVPGSLISNNIKAVLWDRQGNFWAGSSDNGLGLLAVGSTQWQSFRAGGQSNQLSGNDISCLLEAHDALWIGTRSTGLNQYILYKGQPRFRSYRARANDVRSLGTDDVRSLCFTQDRQLWVATYGGGMALYHPERDDFTRVTSQQGLVDDFVYGILEDKEGTLWLSTNRGLANYDRGTGRFSSYGMVDGLQSDEFNTGAFCSSSEGHLYFGGVNGFNDFDPLALRATLALQKSFRPPVVLTGLIKMGQPLALTDVLPGALKLMPSDKFFSFEWAALAYRNPQKNRYAYRLEGFDSDWVDNGNRHFAGYTNLDPGHYRLRLKAADPSGVWNEGVPLEITVLQPFYQTWWFQLLALVSVVLCGLAAWRIREYYLTWRGIKYVGQFRILRKLGEGGSGTVYLARNRLTRAQVALKVLHGRVEEAPDGVRRFVQEAEIGTRLSHPNLVTLFESGSHGKTRYIAMEYLQGQTLRELLDRPKPLSVEEIEVIFRQMLAGLAAVHAEKVVHRDLKAANIMVLEGMHIKIMDFGLARLNTLTTIENSDQLMGTLAYMSPEQTLGKSVDLRSDIYSLGVILFEMLYGRMPFLAQNQMEMIYAIHNEDPPRLELNDPNAHKYADVARKCMEKDRRDRYASVAELSADFEEHALRETTQTKGRT